MNTHRLVSAAELAVFERQLPPGMAEGMRDLAVCLFEALVLTSPNAGTAQPGGAWAQQLQAWAELVIAQLQHVSAELGGQGHIYIAKGLSMRLSVRNEAMCARFTGNNYDQLAREYNLTAQQVRNIVDTWQEAKFRDRQGTLALGA